jgi:coenzyme PQQ precursor peptide PqqA
VVFFFSHEIYFFFSTAARAAGFWRLLDPAYLAVNALKIPSGGQLALVGRTNDCRVVKPSRVEVRTSGMLTAFASHRPAVRRRGKAEEIAMKQWRTPKVVEISCGCEINAYFPAEL